MMASTLQRSAWDAGLETRWTLVSEDRDKLPIDAYYIKTQVLRVANGTAEDDHIDALIWAAVRDCEAYIRMGFPGRAIAPQTWDFSLSGFPSCGRIVLPIAPVIDVISVQYYDENGESQELAVSPAGFALVPSGAWTAGEIRPLPGEVFPATEARPDAVTIRFTAGYEDSDAPALKALRVGIGLHVAETYANRTGSPSFALERFWGGPF
jgi:uncharacterized phiE125 gp8 family phage protein